MHKKNSVKFYGEEAWAGPFQKSLQSVMSMNIRVLK